MFDPKPIDSWWSFVHTAVMSANLFFIHKATLVRNKYVAKRSRKQGDCKKIFLDDEGCRMRW
jgi:hypothetical protein